VHLVINLIFKISIYNKFRNRCNATISTFKKKYFMIRIIVLAALLTVSSMTGLFAQTFNKLKADSLMDAIAINNKAMFSVSIEHDGTPVYSRAIGDRSIEGANKTAATTSTRYRIGSITKVFTGVMTFQLIEEGKIKLSTPISDFFPGLLNGNKITIENLLNHSSGLHNFTNDSSYLSILDKKVTKADMLVKFKAMSQDFEPGTKHEYSNTNFVLLGYIIEAIDKDTYANSLKKRITSKIGLVNTYYGGKISEAGKEAFSYSWKNGWQIETETDMSIPAGAGALVSTPADLNKFISELFAGKLISATSLNQMKTIKDGYGMALFAVPFYNKSGFSHNGSIDGFQSQVIYFPEDKLAISYTANGVNTVMNSIVIGLLSIYYNRPYSIPSFKSINIPSEALDKFLGVYSNDQVPVKITVTKKDGALYAQATGQPSFPLEAISATDFKFEQAGIVVAFDAAKKQLTMKQGGGAYVFKKDL
jgi:D-alanyl-D-alanine carboxypeptidase